jgi:XTP/dITP diphosphohydrolase
VHLLIATTNPGKAKEFREMLGDTRFQWITLADLPPIPEVEETGHTFRANAILKATTYAKVTGHWTLADDSGLEVDALNNMPGIYSARWARMHDAGQGDAANNALLLQQLKDIEPAQTPVSEVLRRAGSDGKKTSGRTARFVCVLALANPHGQTILTTRATMEGTIAFAPVGSHGFGYDPLFKVAGLDRTSAELPPAEKHRISHRGRALDRMKALLDRLNLEASSNESTL